ncbi:hypothetical protein LBMAG42_16740 [Deltaproteobacteria bacterium]|nr:hypothetical protein LBMAG42_16740 [Deltaproteobacteria bacterium]
MLLLISFVFANEKLAKPPERVEMVADGLSFFRAGDDAEGGDPTPPESDSESAYEGWIRVMEVRKDRRADLVEADTLVRDYSPVIADCALKAGAVAGASAAATVSIPITGVIKVAAGSGDAALAGCVASTLHKRQTGAILHGGRNIEPKYTFTLVAPPASVPATEDIEASFAGVVFGEPSSRVLEPRLSSSYRNTRHYTRMIDDNVQCMGIDCRIAYDFEDDEGLYGGEIRVEGDAASFRLREGLKARFGAGRWDGSVKAWYWRGERLIYVSVRVPDTTYEVLRILDMERARRAGLATSFPGDPEGENGSKIKSLPKVLREELAAPPAPDAPAAP